MVLAAGAKWSHVLGLLGASIVSIPFAFIGLVTDYQRDRIALWLDPESDPLGAGFQSLQAQIGIGSGGAYATAAARALVAHTDLPAERIVEEALKITADICVYTNREITVETLG